MGRYERSIKIAFDKVSREILDADEVFDETKNAFDIRRQYHEKNLLLSCCECEQDLMVSGSKYDRLHFKHKSGHEYCILSDGQLSPEEHEKFTEILKSKESDRHKELKNKIGLLLHSLEGIDKNSIAIDNRFIIREGEKRRPDVYCKYQGKELVFEIQLSDLSLGYILSRYEFYKKHGMYLIWILDNFDIHNQGTLERDIKYLTKYENFFKLDESSDTFYLGCEYKFPFLTDDNNFLTKWLKKSVALIQLSFDNEDFQIYYYNFGDNRTKIEAKQKEIAEKIKEAERKKIEEQRKSNADRKSNEIIREIKELRERKSQNFTSAFGLIKNLDKYELQVLNSILEFNSESKQKKKTLLKWLSTASQNDIAFIEFILDCPEIELNVNQTDGNGKTAFQTIFENQEIHKYIPVKSIFKRDYNLTETDKEFYFKLYEQELDRQNDFYIYNFCNRLIKRSLVDLVFSHSKLLFIIESAKQQKIIGFNYKPTEWIAFANNAIQYHSEYWEYIEMAFKGYGLWEILTKTDRKGTFEKKVQAFYSEMPKQKYDIDEIFKDLYPELFYD
jgi:competence CoiA-like predicted nuclease